jgi:hypothetical protein
MSDHTPYPVPASALTQADLRRSPDQLRSQRDALIASMPRTGISGDEWEFFVRSLRGEESSKVIAAPTAEQARLVGRIHALSQRLEELERTR